MAFTTHNYNVLALLIRNINLISFCKYEWLTLALLLNLLAVSNQVIALPLQYPVCVASDHPLEAGGR